MRAIFLSSLPNETSLSLKDEKHHHLVHVLKVKVGEELLLLDGKGQKAKAKILSLTKKEILLQVDEKQTINAPNHTLELALAIPKKEALELSLKQAVEIGFSKIHLFRGDHSQTELPTESRLSSVLESALEQSNQAFMPQICVFKKIEDLMDKNQSSGVVLDLSASNSPLKLTQSVLMLIGPEGGWSEREKELFKAKGYHFQSLPTAILRTPTAVGVGAGFLLHELMRK